MLLVENSFPSFHFVENASWIQASPSAYCVQAGRTAVDAWKSDYWTHALSIPQANWLSTLGLCDGERTRTLRDDHPKASTPQDTNPGDPREPDDCEEDNAADIRHLTLSILAQALYSDGEEMRSPRDPAFPSSASRARSRNTPPTDITSPAPTPRRCTAKLASPRRISLAGIVRSSTANEQEALTVRRSGGAVEVAGVGT